MINRGRRPDGQLPPNRSYRPLVMRHPVCSPADTTRGALSALWAWSEDNLLCSMRGLRPFDHGIHYAYVRRARAPASLPHQFQETIVSTLGKGGNHAFITLRADFLGNGSSDLESDQGWLCQSDWLGGVLPARATNLRGEWRQKDRRQEASTFLAYLRHQRDWLRAIERARAPSVGGSSSGIQRAEVSEGLDKVVLAVEDAVRESREGEEESNDASQPLVTARRWRRLAG